MSILHKTSGNGRWYEFSLAEQLGNIGSEVHRALNAKNNQDNTAYNGAIARALELFDFTIQDSRWHKFSGRIGEIARAREMFVDAMYGGKEYGSTFENLDQYFFQFALAARVHK